MSLLTPYLLRQWSPGINDPTLLGWLIVVAYVVAAACSLRARRVGVARGDRVIARFWLVAALLLLLLALNKQLDLQTWLVHTGRDLARDFGFYDSKHTIQAVFVIGLALAALITGVLALLKLRGHMNNVGLAGVGLIVLLAFILLRAASVSHVDIPITRALSSAWIAPALELLGAGIVILGARHSRSKTLRAAG